MKKIYLVIVMAMFSVLQSQVIHIPDANFKAQLLAADVTNSIAATVFNNSIKIDTNGNGEIEVSEIQQVGILRLYGTSIADFTGISAFTNLESLETAGNTAPSLDLSSNVNLGSLTISASPQLASLNINNCNLLRRVNLSGISITALDLHNRSVLQYLYIFNTPLTSLNITGCPALYEIDVENTQLASLDASNLPNIFIFYVRSNALLSNINFTNSNMQVIDISSNNLFNVNIQNQSSLRNINCSNNKLSSLNLPGCPDMMEINCDKNLITSLDLSAYPHLIRLKCNNNSIGALDLSHNPEFHSITCSGNNMTFLNIKNGKVQSNYFFSVQGNPNLVICCDENEAALIQSWISNGTLYPNYSVTTYCSFTPGGTFYTINGNTKYDFNNNGCDPNDPNKAFQRFNITNGTTPGSIIANSTGDYSIPVQSGTYTVTPVFENPAYFTVSPPSLTADFPTQASPLPQNFCVSANGIHHDLETVIIPVTAASPGFNAQYKIIYKNKGTAAQSGTLVYNYNDNIMDYQTSTLTPNSQSTGVLNWSFTNLQPFETREITLTLKLNTPTQTPPVSGGDVLHYTAQINGATDETPPDNNAVLNQTVVNSFDPNDKTCLEGTSISQTQAGDYVHYLIRFENTGTANAKNIVVKDEIDMSKFDMATLIPLHGSHNFVTRITNPNVVEFIFENIQLPFTNADNDGYVSFKIKTKSTLTTGNSFSNTAKIYFDYNAPIVTNTFTTAVQNILAVSETIHTPDRIRIYPNPVQKILFIESKDELLKTEIYDATGRIITSMGWKGNSVNVSDLPKGNYIIKMFIKDKTMVQKFIKE
ncbi:MAG: T9SS type A sorting domain-containing protein [Chryseobacterium sp.]|uniref:DUF7619 domain-containing protein n=1 Tax=Chryseobacterium sp. TaxID=1871047 RepID=UPI0025C3BEFC|nr:T9SS type A sorting domain-containing protein [Chryseobacterium sp.]MCJ7935042.1 T9SS type A sorting domain-containing protein [Chryseobacterium sp.]